MKTRSLGRSGAMVAVIGQGTWELELADEAEATRALHAGLELGLTHVDTAEMYGDGRVEELLGRALAGKRDESSWPPRSCRRTPRARARCEPANAACGASAPITSTSISCTGAARTRWPRRSKPSRP